jgi:hypothetical protein
VPAVQASDTVVRLSAERRSRNFIELSTYQVTQRVASERIGAEQHDVYRQNDCPQADPELDAPRIGIGKPKRPPNIKGQENQKP